SSAPFLPSSLLPTRLSSDPQPTASGRHQTQTVSEGLHHCFVMNGLTERGDGGGTYTQCVIGGSQDRDEWHTCHVLHSHLRPSGQGVGGRQRKSLRFAVEDRTDDQIPFTRGQKDHGGVHPSVPQWAERVGHGIFQKIHAGIDGTLLEDLDRP